MEPEGSVCAPFARGGRSRRLQLRTRRASLRRLRLEPLCRRLRRRQRRGQLRFPRLPLREGGLERLCLLRRGLGLQLPLLVRA